MKKWKILVENLLKLLEIDRLFSKEEYDKIIIKINNKDELNNFLQLLLEKKQRLIQLGTCPKCDKSLQEFLLNKKCKVCKKHFKEFTDLVESEDKNIDMLKRKMALAVEQERYEDAAIYRDKIKSLTATNG